MRKIDAKRKRYNPDLEGYGNPDQWRKNFSERIGFEEAHGILRKSERDARELLGVNATATWGDIIKAFRRKALAYHPDRVRVTGMTAEEATEAFKEIRAAYTVLAHEYGKCAMQMGTAADEAYAAENHLWVLTCGVSVLQELLCTKAVLGGS